MLSLDPTQSVAMTADPHSIASSWLAAFASAVDAADIDALAELFTPDGWLRDLLVSTWDNRSLEGREKIHGFLSSTLAAAELNNIKLDDTDYLAPRTSFIAQLQSPDVESAFTFECAHGHGQGYVRLLPDGTGDHKAFTVMLMLSELHGHEESNTLILREDLTGVPGRNMQEEFADWVTQVERKPYVLVGMFQAMRVNDSEECLLKARSGWRTNWTTARGPVQADEHICPGYRAQRATGRRLAEAVPVVDTSHPKASPQP